MINSVRRPRFHIHEVRAKNFRSIADATFDLERLTVLVGPNASGKSNLLDVLRFIKDALQRDLDAAVSTRQGFDAIGRRVRNEVSSEVEIGITASTSSYEPESAFNIDYGFRIASVGDNKFQVGYEFAKVSASEEETLIVDFRIEEGNLVSPKSLVRQNIEQTSFLDEYDPDFDRRDLTLPTFFRLRRSLNRISYELESSGQKTTDALRALNSFFRHLLHMRFYHIFPNTIREPRKLMNARYLDEDAINLASVLREMVKGNPLFLNRLKKDLSNLIPGVIDLDVTSAGGYLIVRLKHISKGNEEWFDLSQESDGTIRLVGLLTALNQRVVPLIGIEEPELTVHPGTMTALASLFKEFSKRSQLIITTHSPDFIDCVSDYRNVNNIRIVDNTEGVTTVGSVSKNNVETVKQHLFSPGDLHRMGELTTLNSSQ